MLRFVALFGLSGALALTASCSNAPAEGRAAAPDGTLRNVQGNVFTSSSQGQAALATATDGRTALVWESKRQERGTFGVYARLFDRAGQPLSHEFHVNTHLPRAQWHPAAAFSDDNTLWFAWESFSQDGSGSGLVARAFDQEGQPLSAELPINLQREGDQVDVALVAAAEGGALAVWASHHPDSSFHAANGIRARLMHASDLGTVEIVMSTQEGAQDRRPS
ncbi:MAG: hypothetical protein ACPG31_14065, partial [Planctomycetota bacterium]